MMDVWDDIDEAELEMYGMHVEDESTPVVGNDPVVCEWNVGDDEGFCVLDRYGCHQLGCVLTSEV